MMRTLAPSSHQTRRTRRRGGFTLPEFVLAAAIFTLVIGGVIYSHVMGGRLYQLTLAKLGGTDEARRAVTWIESDVRAARLLDIGTGSAASFAPAVTGAIQQGNALQLSFTTNSAIYVRYFVDATTGELNRQLSWEARPRVIARKLADPKIFRGEDYLGTPQTGENDATVVRVLLTFTQLTYPRVNVGTTNFFESFQLLARATRRLTD